MTELGSGLAHAAEALSVAAELRGAGRMSEAERVYRDGIETFPDLRDQSGHPWFLKEYLRALLDERRWADAEALVAASEPPPGETWLDRLFARAFSKAGHAQAAMAAWGRILATEPRDKEALGWISDRIDDIFAELETTSRETVPFKSLARAIGRFELDEAWDHYRKGARIFAEIVPGDAENPFVRAMFDRSIDGHRIDKLELLIDDDIRELSRFALHVDNTFRKRISRYDDLQRHFQHKLLEISKTEAHLSHLVRVAVGSHNVDLGREAARRLRKVVSCAPHPGAHALHDVHVLSADACLCAGDWDGAERNYSAARQARPDSVVPLLGLAAVMIDRGRLDACAELLREADALQFETDLFILPNLIRHLHARITTGRGHAPVSAPLPSIDLLIFSHATERMKKNTHLAPPHTTMIATIVRDAVRRASDDVSLATTIMYDHRDTPLSRDYLNNLEELALRESVSLVVNEGNGLRRQWLDGLARTNGEFVLIVEQDHAFLQGCPNWRVVIDLLRKRSDLNYVRFNRRNNVRWLIDCGLYQTARDVKDGVTRAPMHSNTPHLMRRSFYDAIIYPIITGSRSFDGQNGGAAGVEESINTVIEDMARRLGEPITSRLFGLSIWRNLGGAATTRTLGF